MGVVEQVQALVTPVLADLGLELYDLEHAGGTLRVTVDRPGGVDLDALATATRLISRQLDEVDPVPGRYTLEVTSPGLERSLRTPEHFRRAVGSTVAVRTRAGVEGPRRVTGVLAAADDDGITVDVVDGPEAGSHRLAHPDIERARTVFEWAASPKPGSARRRPARSGPSDNKAGAS